MTTIQTLGPTESSFEISELAREESHEARIHRRSIAVLLGIVGVAFLVSLGSTHGVARFALSDAFADVQLPTIALPGVPTVLICALTCLGVAIRFWWRRLSSRQAALLGALAGAAVVLGFLTWAAADRSLPFPVSNQFAGTLALATPLVFGAMTGVMCERSGVVNVSIEGQMLTGAFAAALTGSITGSIAAALIAAMLAAVMLAALLALFSIRYLVDQVVLGVVLNLLASGLTGFVFDQLVQPQSDRYNSAPVLQTIAIPGLSKIPFLGPVLFTQTILAYLAFVSVGLVWLVLNRTGWGLRIRAVGEHPEAADTAGISVFAIRWSAVLFGGLFAGLGGAYFSVGSVGAFNKDMTAGAGFIALAAVIMGRWKPVSAMIMALFFGFVSQITVQLQSLQTPMPSEFLLILPYLATVIAVAGLVGRVRAPAADGKPFTKA